jgi:hypothetical protein
MYLADILVGSIAFRVLDGDALVGNDSGNAVVIPPSVVWLSWFPNELMKIDHQI